MSRERDFSWLDNSILTDLSADGKTMLFYQGDLKDNIYIRRTDNTTAIHLGEGYGYSLSPDGRWVVAQVSNGSNHQLALLSTGAGQAQVLNTSPVSNYLWAAWLPDGRRIVFTGSESGHGSRCYVMDVAGGQPRAISPEGSATPSALPVSSDGKEVALSEPDGRTVLYSVNGNGHRPVAGLPFGDTLIRWSADERFVYHYRLVKPPVSVYRLNLQTGRDELWKELRPPDLAGAVLLAPMVITPDAQSYAYSVRWWLSQLYLVDTSERRAP
jgi:dipeptidyl aminopeptidase/acylaminoacyl peptidase